MQDSLDFLRAEATIMREKSLISAERHYAAEGPWYNLHYLIGIPSAVLATLAGAAALSQISHSEIVAGVISLLVAVLTALLTFLDPNKKAETFHRFAKAYERLYHESGYFCRVELQSDDIDPKELQKNFRPWFRNSTN